MDALRDIIENKDGDREIARQEPMRVMVAGHPVFCRCFTYRNHQRWLGVMGTTLVQFQSLFRTLDLPEKFQDLKKARIQFSVLLAQRKLYDTIVDLLCRTLLREPGNEWWRKHRRKFRREVTVQEIVDLFFYCYLFNYEAVKKNISFLLERMGLVKKRDTYTSSSTSGLAGIVSESIKPRFASSPFISKDGEKLTILSRPKSRSAPAGGDSGSN
jgi:hypothetical protein